MSIVLGHHWIMSYRGGERVLEQLALLFPESPVFTLCHDRDIEVPGLVGRDIRTSAIDDIPLKTKLYKHLLPLHPWAISKIRIPEDTRLLISSDASLFKGISVPEGAAHICYCHSPPRYLWELGDDYKRNSLLTRCLMDRFVGRLRQFDQQASENVSYFIANSQFVRQRIKQYYGRESEVIYPPVAVHEFTPNRVREAYYLVLSELTPYKRIDLAVRAFASTSRKLIIIGDGSERKRLAQEATPNIKFLGRQPFSSVKYHLEHACALVFPGIEDFGITPVESQASGCPVIAFRGGGALETVISGETGIFFDEQTPQSLNAALEKFEDSQFSAEACATNATNFSTQRFQRALINSVQAKVDFDLKLDALNESLAAV
jgi:glycosyltransferase involved in cell wall biosynthesis